MNPDVTQHFLAYIGIFAIGMGSFWVLWKIIEFFHWIAGFDYKIKMEESRRKEAIERIERYWVHQTQMDKELMKHKEALNAANAVIEQKMKQISDSIYKIETRFPPRTEEGLRQQGPKWNPTKGVGVARGATDPYNPFDAPYNATPCGE